jgi:hypothetical protein
MSAFEIYDNEAKLAFPYLAPNSFIRKPTTIDKLVQLLETQRPTLNSELGRPLLPDE